MGLLIWGGMLKEAWNKSAGMPIVFVQDQNGSGLQQAPAAGLSHQAQ